jgi:ATP:cob(I)alamin adenosyltransferase
MRITKVYTRTGDAGKTRLAGGQQVWKDSLRVEAYGTLDELNAVVGVVRVMNAEMVGSHAQAGQLEADLRWIQNKLFDLGGILATMPGQELSKGFGTAQRVHFAWRGKGVGISTSGKDSVPPCGAGMRASFA